MRYTCLAALLPLFLSACQSGIPADVISLPAPDDPQSATRAQMPADYFNGYVDRKPVLPAPWRPRAGHPAPGEAQ